MSTMKERLKQERNKMLNRGSGGTDMFFKLPKTDEAEVKIRILPAKNWYDANEDEVNLFYKKFGIHWINGKRIVCPYVTHGDKCPICETVWELRKSTDEDDIETAKQFAAKKRHWANIVEVDDNENPVGEPKIFEFGVKLLTNIIEWCVDSDYDDLSDPEHGYTYRVIKKKVDGFPNYDSSKPMKNPHKIDEKVMRDLLEKCADIHQMIDNQVKSYDEIKAEFDLGTPASYDDSDGDVEDVNADELLKKINERISA